MIRRYRLSKPVEYRGLNITIVESHTSGWVNQIIGNGLLLSQVNGYSRSRINLRSSDGLITGTLEHDGIVLNGVTGSMIEERVNPNTRLSLIDLLSIANGYYLNKPDDSWLEIAEDLYEVAQTSSDCWMASSPRCPRCSKQTFTSHPITGA